MAVTIETVFLNEQPILEFELLDQDGVAIDLTTVATTDIEVLLRIDGAVSNLFSSPQTNATAINGDPTTGKFTWQWPAVIQAAEEGNLRGQIKVVLAAGHTRATEWFNLNVDTGLLP